MTTSVLLIVVGHFALSAAAATPRTLIVSTAADVDSTDEFGSIQAALDSIPVNNRERIVIEIRDGIYYEKIRIDADRITLRGESRAGVHIRYHLPRSEYDRRYDTMGPAVVNIFGDDIILENLTIENVQLSREHAFAIYGQPNRTIIQNCDVLGNGGDTVSLWNTSFGMYYHRDCRFRGGVDFVCPRGWCFVRDCIFECPTSSAALWHDGHMDLDMKFVLRNCSFMGGEKEKFWLGRNHYPSQFYLLDCSFDENMADKPIGTVKELPPGVDRAPYERKYFFRCHRAGGDYVWHADNLAEAAGAPAAEDITAAWTFGGRWDPESNEPPSIRGVEVDGDLVYVYFSEDVAGVQRAHLERSDGTQAAYDRGSGSRRLVFRGGTSDSSPVRLVTESQEIHGTLATLQSRFVPAQDLPDSTPRRVSTMVLVGDSTVANYDADHPCQGWGQALPHFLDDRIKVRNLARGGRSSKSFRAEGWWAKAQQLPADYILIQFGHNDNPGKGPARETDPSPGGDFRENLRRYVEEARAMGAVPVLVSPPVRRVYDENGQISTAGANAAYAEATRAVADELHCAFVDLHRLSITLFNRLGEASSDWMQPVGDRTHFTAAGADRVAGIVAEQLRAQLPSLQPMLRDQSRATRQ